MVNHDYMSAQEKLDAFCVDEHRCIECKKTQWEKTINKWGGYFAGATIGIGIFSLIISWFLGI